MAKSTKEIILNTQFGLFFNRGTFQKLLFDNGLYEFLTDCHSTQFPHCDCGIFCGVPGKRLWFSCFPPSIQRTLKCYWMTTWEHLHTGPHVTGVLLHMLGDAAKPSPFPISEFSFHQWHFLTQGGKLPWVPFLHTPWDGRAVCQILVWLWDAIFILLWLRIIRIDRKYKKNLKEEQVISNLSFSRYLS